MAMGQAFQSLFDDFSSAVQGMAASQAVGLFILVHAGQRPFAPSKSPLQCQCQCKPDLPAAHFQCPTLRLLVLHSDRDSASRFGTHLTSSSAVFVVFFCASRSCSVCAGRMRRIVVWQCASNFLSNDDQSTCW